MVRHKIYLKKIEIIQFKLGIGWITLSFWILKITYTALGNPIIASSSSIDVIVRNSIGVFIAGLVVASSHNVFQKIRIY